jgi:hypothetical protein
VGRAIIPTPCELGELPRFNLHFEPVHGDIDGLTGFHNHLSMQAVAYQNGV